MTPLSHPHRPTSHRILPALAAAAALFATGGAAAAPPAQARAGSEARLGAGIAAAAHAHPARALEVIVQTRGDGAAARAAVSSAGGVIVQEIPLIHGFAARLSARAASTLRFCPAVRVVSLDAGVQATSLSGGAANTSTSNLGTNYDAAIQAPQVWSMGATGAGVGVAVIDTGIAGGLPDFQVSPGNPASRVIASAVVNPDATGPGDTYGHGTHVAGIIAGDSWNRGSGDPLAGKYIGVAPSANLISIKADDGHGHATVLDLIDGIQFAVDHQSQLGVRVINLSVRSDVAQSYRTDPLDAAVEEAWLKGIVVVAAAGNLGTSSDAVDYAPANDPYAIAVGAVDDQGTPGSGDDRVPSWSSRGTTQDGFAKPDILAPGAHIVSTLAPGSDFASLCASCVTDGAYFRAGGTSMAAAVVSGAVADLLSIDPSWTPAEVKGALLAGTHPVPDADTGNTDRVGEVNLVKTLALSNASTPVSADQGLTPNQFVDPASGNITDSTGAWATGSWGTGSWGTGSWGSGTWAAATGAFVAPWAPTTSYTGAPLPPTGFAPVPPDCIQLQRANWSTGSWATAGWTSDELNAALQACTTASSQAGTWGTGSWGTGSWGTGSWGTGSWGTGSWGTGSWGTGSWSTGSWGTGSWSTDFDK
jgi:serine protease AprX